MQYVTPLRTEATALATRGDSSLGFAGTGVTLPWDPSLAVLAQDDRERNCHPEEAPHGREPALSEAKGLS
jgi:hypothetical protein